MGHRWCITIILGEWAEREREERHESRRGRSLARVALAVNGQEKRDDLTFEAWFRSAR